MRGPPRAEKARRHVREAIKEGRLRKPSEYLCVDCGEPAEQYDHRDYAKPLEVEPVCRSCNWYRGSAANNDRQYHNGLEAQGYGFLAGDKNKPDVGTGSVRAPSDLVDEYWTTWEPDLEWAKALQELASGRRRKVQAHRNQRSTRLGDTRSFMRGLYDWFGVEPL